ncbi:hypothetical protein MASR2M32_21400 [Sphaerotilus sulfidivorans]
MSASALDDRRPLPSPERLRALIDTLGDGLLERDTETRLALLAALAGEHVLLLGPPGTAKSELARRLHRAFDGAPYFERLLTRFSTPEELFGPLSLKALEEDRHERLTAGFLPEAGIAFLDEVFKANSAILNALLTLLNEREFDNGSGRVRVPLLSVVGASNEVPADEALRAFFDRFLVRLPVAPVSEERFEALLRLDERDSQARSLLRPAPEPGLEAAEREAVHQAATRVALGEEAVEALHRLRRWLAAQQPAQALSDRRWRQLVGLMKVAAATEGRTQVDALDLWLAPQTAAPLPELAPALQDWFAQEIAGAVPQDAPWLTRAVEALERQLQLEQRAESEASGSGEGDLAGKMALARATGGGRDADGSAGTMRMMSQALDAASRRRWSPVHVAARVAQVDETIAAARPHHEAALAAAEALSARLEGRLWMPPACVAALLGAHLHTALVLQALLDRLEAVRAGFAGLPVQAPAEGAEAPPPAPVLLED